MGEMILTQRGTFPSEPAYLDLPVRVTLSVQQIADAFAQLSDDGQAQVLIEVARIAETWEPGPVSIRQWHAVGRHLRTCACSTPEARDLVREMASGVGEEGDE